MTDKYMMRNLKGIITDEPQVDSVNTIIEPNTTIQNKGYYNLSSTQSMHQP